MCSFRYLLWTIRRHFRISSKNVRHSLYSILTYLQIPWYCILNKYFSWYCIHIMYVLLIACKFTLFFFTENHLKNKADLQAIIRLEFFFQLSKHLQLAAIQYLLKINYNGYALVDVFRTNSEMSFDGSKYLPKWTYSVKKYFKISQKQKSFTISLINGSKSCFI